MPTYRGSFRYGGTWEITVPRHAAPGQAAEVDGCPGAPHVGWSVVGETDQTLQLTRAAYSRGEAAGATYDLVLNKVSGRLTITASNGAGGAGRPRVLYGETTGS